MANKLDRFVAIDPGPTESAYVIYDGFRLIDFAKYPNADVAYMLSDSNVHRYEHCVIEMIGHYGTGMPAGKDVFETCIWIGRFMERFGAERVDRILRATVKTHVCGSARAKDGNVRQALIDRFGGKAAIKKGGPLYGVSGDVWQALALAVTWAETPRKAV